MVELTATNIKLLMVQNGIKPIDIADRLNISVESAYPKIREAKFDLEQVKELGRLFNVDFIIKRKED